MSATIHNAEFIGYQYRYRESHPDTVNFGQWCPWQDLAVSRLNEFKYYVKTRPGQCEIRKIYAVPDDPVD